MQSIYGMPSDDLAGGAERRVPSPLRTRSPGTTYWIVVPGICVMDVQKKVHPSCYNRTVTSVDEKDGGTYMSEFNKVIGYEEIKIELERICNIMKYPGKYEKLGVRMPAGVLLYGVPGVGKTLMAKCFIAESGRKALTIRKDRPDGDFVDTIRETFDQAKTEAPCIVFLDDMDKFANEDQMHRDAEEYVAVQACIDDVKEADVFVIATVNDKWALPDSLVRAGRFDKVIEVLSPRGDDAAQIIEHFLSNKNVMGEVNAKEIARLIEGHSCADLETVINEAGIYAGYAGKESIDQEDIVKACLRLLFDAPEKICSHDAKYLNHIAVHEAGHAVLAEILEPDSVNMVSVCSFAGKIEGITELLKRDDLIVSQERMEHCIIGLLGGKAAIEIMFGITDTGCNNDLQKAFDLVEELVDNYCTYGFHAFERHNSSGYLLEMKDRMIAAEMERYYQCAKKLLIENRDFLKTLTDALMEKQTLMHGDIMEVKEKCMQPEIKKCSIC